MEGGRREGGRKRREEGRREGRETRGEGGTEMRSKEREFKIIIPHDIFNTLL